MKADLLIKGGTILTLNGRMEVLEDHCLVIESGKIIQICPFAKLKCDPAETIDASGCLVMPGMINTHSHLPMTYFRGLADDLPLDTWLNKYIWPLEAKLIDHDFVFDASVHGAAEMIHSGITLTNDMYFQMSAIADACSLAGLRVIVAEAMIDSKPGGDTAIESIGRKVLELREKYADNPLVDFSLAPHAIYTCSEATLRRSAEEAVKHGLLLHMHLSETKSERESCLHTHLKSPVQYLRDLGVLEARCVFAHGVWVDEVEMAMLASAHASIALCTDSNLKLASGIAPIKAYREKGVRLSLATDGVASNNNLDLLAEMDFTAKLHKVINHDPAFLPAEELVRMATIEAARALGKGDELGSLEEGKAADLLVLNLQELEAQPLYNPYSHLVYALNSHSIRDVVIAGSIVMRSHKLVNVNETELISKAQSYKARILAEQ
ncbi:MAG TPA: amidohydrolase [Candidatus Cloacimonadota bacterium]|nr:amidohydrolase [Candidatus Cloacimonadota bacterium]